MVGYLSPLPSLPVRSDKPCACVRFQLPNLAVVVEIRNPPLQSPHRASLAAATPMSPPRLPLPAALLALLVAAVVSAPAGGVDVLSKSQVQRCALDSCAGGRLSCDRKLVLNLAVPSGSSGGEASIVAHVVQAEENGTQKMQTVRDPPIITIEKTAAYAIFALTYLKDVAYRPEEQYVTTRKCEPDAGGDVVGSCARLWDNDGKIIPHTEPICCPCGPNRRVPSSCGNVFDKMIKGKANTAHCLRFPGSTFGQLGQGLFGSVSEYK